VKLAFELKGTLKVGRMGILSVPWLVGDWEVLKGEKLDVERMSSGSVENEVDS